MVLPEVRRRQFGPAEIDEPLNLRRDDPRAIASQSELRSEPSQGPIKPDLGRDGIVSSFDSLGDLS